MYIESRLVVANQEGIRKGVEVGLADVSFYT